MTSKIDFEQNERLFFYPRIALSSENILDMNVFLGDPVCNVVNLTKTVLYMGETNHYFVAI